MKRFLLLHFLSLILITAFAQDPEFTQFYANPLYLNPAFAGTGGGPRFAMNFRDQWPSVPKSWVTYAASWDQHFDRLAGGLGAQVLYDQSGVGALDRLEANAIYSYQLIVNTKLAIKMAVKAGFQQLSVDYSKLNFGDEIDPKLGFIFPTKEPAVLSGSDKIGPFPDFGAGILAYTTKFFGGFAVDHINEPKQSFLGSSSYLPMKYTAHMGLMLPLENDRFPTRFFSPNIMFQNQDKFWQLNFGAYFIKDKFVAGIWARETSANFDALMALVGITAGPIKFGYSYDITFSEARYGANGSHEVSLIVQLKPPENQPNTKWRQLKCPSF